MARLITQYNILISCPSDVQEELNIINQVIVDFNKTIGDSNNVVLSVKHWSTHSYPESGGKPQDLLNKQIVLDCDAAIAVFWTRFGTPTDDYGSGTEEEIELLLKKDKQVFLYFSNSPISPSEVDSTQYGKVKDFQKKFREQGIYSEYERLEEFRQSFTNHLNLHFLKIIDENETPLMLNKTPNLTVKGIDDGFLIESPRAIHQSLLSGKFINDQNLNIDKLFKDIKGINFPIETEQDRNDMIENNDDHLVSEPLRKIGQMTININEKSKRMQDFFEQREIVIRGSDKKAIKNYADGKGITLEVIDFYNIGNLVETKSITGGGPYGIGPSYQLSGNEDEKKKYRLICSLAKRVNSLNEWIVYLGKIESKHFLKLAVTNNGTTFDEDVDVKLFIRKGALVTIDEIPFPGNQILETVTESLDSFYNISGTHNVENYTRNGATVNSVIPRNPLLGISYEKSIQSLRDDFRTHVEDIFIYEYFQDGDFDILTFNISYIKQYTNIAFPTVLLFHSRIDEVMFEINSKHSAEVIKGTLDISI